MAVFAKAGVTPLRAAEASFAREGWDISGFDPENEGYDGGDAKIADLWGEAEDAARVAGCAGWPEERVPREAVLEITGYPENEDEDEALDEAEKRQMFATHLASLGKQLSEAEFDAEYEALIAEMIAAHSQ